MATLDAGRACNAEGETVMRAKYPEKRAAPGSGIKWINAVLLVKSDECQVWPFALRKSGYASFTSSSGTKAVHRYVCIAAHGDPPTPVHQAAHSCNNKACANPAHLRWATPAGNQEDKIRHGTTARGEKHKSAILNRWQVLEIRASELTTKEVATRYGLTFAGAYDVIHRRTWAWL